MVEKEKSCQFNVLQAEAPFSGIPRRIFIYTKSEENSGIYYYKFERKQAKNTKQILKLQFYTDL